MPHNSRSVSELSERWDPRGSIRPETAICGSHVILDSMIVLPQSEIESVE